MSTHTILCGNCQTPVQGPEEPDSQDQIVCSNCGQSDAYADVIESAKTFVTDKAAKGLNAAMASAVKGSKFIKFTPNQVRRRKYRWTVADFEL